MNNFLQIRFFVCVFSLFSLHDHFKFYTIIIGVIYSDGGEKFLLIFNQIWPVGEHISHNSRKITLNQCLESCLDNIYCVAVHHYPFKDEHVCVVFKTRHYGHKSRSMKTELRYGQSDSVFFILPDVLSLYNTSFRLQYAKVVSVPSINSTITNSRMRCQQVCLEDEMCSLYTFRINVSDGDKDCFTYKRETVKCSGIPTKGGDVSCKFLESDPNYTTVFLR